MLLLSILSSCLRILQKFLWFSKYRNRPILVVYGISTLNNVNFNYILNHRHRLLSKLVTVIGSTCFMKAIYRILKNNSRMSMTILIDLPTKI